MANKKSLNQLVPVVKAHQQKLTKEAKAILLQEAKPLFENFPDVEAIRWTQRRALENSELAPFHKSDFCIDNVEYRTASLRAVRDDEDWVSPWNDGRIESPDFLNTLTFFEQQLFDAESALAVAIGDYDRVTITKTNVALDTI